MISRPPSFVPPRSWSIKLTPSQQALADWRRVNLVEEEKALTRLRHVSRAKALESFLT